MMIATYIILVLSWFFIIFGMIAIFRLKNLYTRILTASTIDTVASFLVLIALIFASSQFEYAIRLLLLILFLLITNPISSHVNIRSAYLIGIPTDVKDGDII
jgi:multicomponent Na+:H+ antiporter subunit G